jgi:hypothetical protein
MVRLPAWNPSGLGPDLGYSQLKRNPNRASIRRGFEGPNRRKYETERGMLYGYASTLNNGRRLNGTFTSMRYDQRAANEYSAKRMQDLVVANIEAKIAAGGRGNVSTGRLVKVTGDPQNIDSTTDFFGVGNPEYLDRSQAKYWRTQEEGTARVWKRSFIGDPLIGFWAGSLTGEWRGDRPVGGRPFTRAGMNRSGKFVPFSMNRRKLAAFYDNERTKAGQRSRIPRVRHHIEPMNAYKDAWAQLKRERNLLETMTAWLDPNDVSTARGRLR